MITLLIDTLSHTDLMVLQRLLKPEVELQILDERTLVLRQAGVVRARLIFRAFIPLRLAGLDLRLSAAQGRILEALLEGLSNQEIAQRLGIRVKTVEYHLRRIYAGLGVRNRREAGRLILSHTLAALADPDGSTDR